MFHKHILFFSDKYIGLQNAFLRQQYMKESNCYDFLIFILVHSDIYDHELGTNQSTKSTQRKVYHSITRKLIRV